MAKTEESIRRAFPELERIESQSMRQAVVDIWLRVWQESSWERLEDCPYNPLAPQVSLVAHTNQVTAGALALAEQTQRYVGGSIQWDALRVAALLHDVSKLVEYEPADTGCRKSRLGRSYQHGFYGAHLAQQAGLPMDVVAMIINHTGDSRVVPDTPEGLCLYYADMCAADSARLLAGAALLLRK